MNGTLNKVMLIGRLGSDVKLTYFDKDSCTGQVSLATDESYTDKTTQAKVENTQWHNVVFYNKMAERGTRMAHIDGGVPNIRVVLPQLNAYYIGQLFYFFEKAVGISGYMLEVNPFNQPGVEAYKKNMFALLEKPGFEEESKAIKSRL